MNKAEFLTALRRGIDRLPAADIDKSLDYYAEMIDDRIEDGLSEEEAVAALGSVEEIVEQILLDTPLPKLVKAKVSEQKKRRNISAQELILIILGAPIWLPLLLVVLILAFIAGVSIWSVAVALYIVLGSVGLSALFLFGMAVLMLTLGQVVKSLFSLGVALALLGLTIILFYIANVVTKWLFRGSKWLLRKIKSWFVKK